jgi:hypothetical protein
LLRVAAAERGCFLADCVGLAADGLDLIAASRSRTTTNLDNRKLGRSKGRVAIRTPRHWAPLCDAANR